MYVAFDIYFSNFRVRGLGLSWSVILYSESLGTRLERHHAFFDAQTTRSGWGSSIFYNDTTTSSSAYIMPKKHHATLYEVYNHVSNWRVIRPAKEKTQPYILGNFNSFGV